MEEDCMEKEGNNEIGKKTRKWFSRNHHPQQKSANQANTHAHTNTRLYTYRYYCQYFSIENIKKKEEEETEKLKLSSKSVAEYVFVQVKCMCECVAIYNNLLQYHTKHYSIFTCPTRIVCYPSMQVYRNRAKKKNRKRGPKKSQKIHTEVCLFVYLSGNGNDFALK